MVNPYKLGSTAIEINGPISQSRGWKDSNHTKYAVKMKSDTIVGRQLSLREVGFFKYFWSSQ